MPPLIGAWIVFQALLGRAMDVLFELRQADNPFRRFDCNAHLIAVVSSREVQPVRGRTHRSAKDQPSFRNLFTRVRQCRMSPN
jgi:hypothetical protein